MDLRNWRRVRDGSDHEILLATGITGPQAGFADLAEGLVGPWSMLETVETPPVGVAPFAAHPQDYVSQWSAELTGRGPVVRAVIGYCAGAVFASALTDVVVAHGLGQPTLILIQPEIVTARTLRWQFVLAARAFTKHMQPADVERLTADAAAISSGRQHGHGQATDLAAVADDLSLRYAGIVNGCFARMGLATDLADELTARFAAFLGYLTAAGRLDVPHPGAGAGAAVVASDDQDLALFTGTVVRVSDGGPTMLADPEVAEAVTALLG